MAKPTPFEIHVDPSCISEDHEKENEMPTERVMSNETVVHHDSWGEKESKDEQQTAEEHKPELSQDDKDKKEDEARERRIKKIEAEIQAAARAVVDSIEKDDFDNEDSVLSARTDESYGQESSELIHDEGTELTYNDETEASYESEREFQSEHNSEGAGDSSSHHDGDIDDDVFSSSNRSSARSSINSVHDLHDIDENQKHLTSPTVGEEAASSSENDVISRVPSGSSYIRPSVDNDRTPSKIMNRPPFRTPSSVRAMQMTSPTQSLFSSPRSTKRHMPTVSRLGTPTSHNSPSKRTPTRFKVKKENPLVLLHVTVMPLQWQYSHLMSSSKLPDFLQGVKESWTLLQNKLGDTVFERGILLAHPQDSYEVLEERLLEALELPVQPRAKILKCGHYMGPEDSDAPSSDDELGSSWAIEKREASDWCDICRRNVRLEDIDEVGGADIRFRIKFYASNGLMRAGAWAAAWKEMERVDVEIEPFVDTKFHAELEHLAFITPKQESEEQHLDKDDDFVDEDMMIEDAHGQDRDHIGQETPEEEVRMREEEVRSRMAEEEEMRQKMADDEHLRQLRIAEEEEMKQRFAAEERLKINQMAEELGIRQRMHREDDVRRSMAEGERLREMHSPGMTDSERHELPRQSPSRNGPEYFDIPRQESPRNNPEQYEMPRHSTPRNGVRGDESLSELLVAAFKVAMRDSKNIAIAVLSVFVLFLALRPTSPVTIPASSTLSESPAVVQVTTTVFTEVVMATAVPSVASMVAQVSSVSEASLVVITETVAAPQVTTTVFQERTVTEMIPVPSVASIASESIEVEEDAILAADSTLETDSDNLQSKDSLETQEFDTVLVVENQENSPLPEVVGEKVVLEEKEGADVAEDILPVIEPEGQFSEIEAADDIESSDSLNED